MASAAASSAALPSMSRLRAVLLGLGAFALGAGGDAADLLRQPVLCRLQRLRFVLEVAHAGVGGDDAVEVDGGAQALVGLADLVGVLSQQANVDHGAGA